MNITDFLLARITEDEKAALACEPLQEVPVMGGPRMETYSHGINSYATEDGYPRQRGGSRKPFSTGPDSIESHFVRWEPARVLVECAALRAVVELHQEVGGASLVVPGGLIERVRYCECCDHTDSEGAIAEDATFPCETLRYLAAVYADHADFDEAWRL